MAKTTDELAAEIESLRAAVRTLQHQNQLTMGRSCALGAFVMALIDERARQEKTPLQWLSVFSDKVRNIGRLIQRLPIKTDPVSRAVISAELEAVIHNLTGSIITTFSVDAIKATEAEAAAKAPRWTPRIVEAESERRH